MADERIGEGDDVARHRRFVLQLLLGKHERHVDPEMRARTCLALHVDPAAQQFRQRLGDGRSQPSAAEATPATGLDLLERIADPLPVRLRDADAGIAHREVQVRDRSEEHTYEIQSLMRISYAVFCLKKKKNTIEDNII